MVIVIPKAIAEAVGIREGHRIRVIATGDKIVIEPVGDALWLTVHGKKLGKNTPRVSKRRSTGDSSSLLLDASFLFQSSGSRR